MARVTIKQAAGQTGMSMSLLYKLCGERRLPHFRLGREGRRGKILIDEADLDAFLAAARIEARSRDRDNAATFGSSDSTASSKPRFVELPDEAEATPSVVQ